jgi:hypothetical protein
MAEEWTCKQDGFIYMYTYILHCKDKENSKQIFPEMKPSGLAPNSYFHVSVSDLYIRTIGPPILDLLCEYIKSLTSTVHERGNWE